MDPSTEKIVRFTIWRSRIDNSSVQVLQVGEHTVTCRVLDGELTGETRELAKTALLNTYLELF